MRTNTYWTRFYDGSDDFEPSSFATWVGVRKLPSDIVVDIGCGEGRDSLFWARQEQAQQLVIGLDQSPSAIERARTRTSATGLGERCQFLCVDLLDETWIRLFQQSRKPGQATLFYMRFLLHAVTAEVQEDLLFAIRAVANEGDSVAVEFRTTLDRDRSKAFPAHFRRYQSAADVKSGMEGNGFSLLDEDEGVGLSPFRGEDPHLCRQLWRL